ncbi:GNAT family N-acetyltransferase [Pontibacter chitinilyticus]|uniref:GNAT family N-acetyltransferase n=1 Tax=Pontibacter chitinilyticus TaxID=2674989 RepID=UPI00321BB321
MIDVIRYSARDKENWDKFVQESKNGTFLFYRNYMEYHVERFTDHSLLFYRKGKLVALLPANETGREMCTHGGLTYGGIVTGTSMKVEVMLEVFEAMRLYLQQQGFLLLKYKTVPHIYHQVPAEEDLYALFHNDARLYRRDVYAAVELAQPLPYSRTRRWEVKKAKEGQLAVQRSYEFNLFMHLEQELLLEKYKAAPVHTAEEMTWLASLFPAHIKLYTASAEETMLAGIIIYETTTVAHCQYIGTTTYGREIAALDVLLDWLLTEVYRQKKYFSFGASMDPKSSSGLHHSLLRNKESYGARAIVQDFYELAL